MRFNLAYPTLPQTSTKNREETAMDTRISIILMVNCGIFREGESGGTLFHLGLTPIKKTLGFTIVLKSPKKKALYFFKEPET